MAKDAVRKLMTVDMPEGEPLEECRHAIELIMTTWPDFSVTKEELFKRACGYLIVDEIEGKHARYLVIEFIRECKPHPVVIRSKRFWEILSSLFEREKVLHLYLSQLCPIAERQHQTIRKHLQTVGFTNGEVKKEFASMRRNGKKET